VVILLFLKFGRGNNLSFFLKNHQKWTK